MKQRKGEPGEQLGGRPRARASACWVRVDTRNLLTSREAGLADVRAEPDLISVAQALLDSVDG